MSALSGGDGALSRLARLVQQFDPSRDAIFLGGTIMEVGAGYGRIAGLGRNVSVGDVLFDETNSRPQAEVVQVDSRTALIAPYHTTLDLGAHMFRRGPLSVAPTENWVGRIINAFGEPIDDRGPLSTGRTSVAVSGTPPAALQRRLISAGVTTGVKAIDLFAPLCVGQRMGVFAGSGVGKSTLLNMLARSEHFDLTIVGLVGERGREVREFVDRLAAGGRSKLIVVVATSDESALQRRLAALTTMAVAEYFETWANPSW